MVYEYNETNTAFQDLRYLNKFYLCKSGYLFVTVASMLTANKIQRFTQEDLRGGR